MSKPFEGHEFDALRLNFEHQVQNLRYITRLDLQVFGGYLTLQLALGGWLSQAKLPNPQAKVGMLLIDLALAVIAAKLLLNSSQRRKEVVATLRNLNEERGAYLEDRAINAPTKLRLWLPWYLAGIAVVFVGVCLVILAA
jgi:hypothetical protein